MQHACGAELTVSLFDSDRLERSEVSLHVSVWGDNAGGGKSRLNGEEDESFGKHVYLDVDSYVLELTVGSSS